MMRPAERKKGPISHLKSEFIGDSLTDRSLLRQTGKGKVIRMLPEVNVLKIGGQSIIDRGKKAVYPLLEEIVKNKKKHKNKIELSKFCKFCRKHTTHKEIK